MDSLRDILRRLTRGEGETPLKPASFQLSDVEREERCPHGRLVRLYRTLPSDPWQTENRCPDCWRERVKRRLYAASGIAEHYWPGGEEEATFEAFDLSINPAMEHPLLVAREYCEDGAPPWLVLIGGTGNGKTHLAKAIAMTFLERMAKVRFWAVPEFLDQLRATFAPESDRDFQEEMAQLAYLPDLVVMDDYGTQSPTPWANERMYTVLNMRYEKRKRTVITCNSPRSLLVEPRIKSRLYDSRVCQVVHCQGQDVRPKLRDRRMCEQSTHSPSS